MTNSDKPFKDKRAHCAEIIDEVYIAFFIKTCSIANGKQN
jgi:hypothetical protein